MGFKVTLELEKCSGCEECMETCTCGVFEMRDGKSSLAEAEKCIGCLSCIEVCEQQAICVEETGVQMSDQCLTLLRDIL